VMISKPTKMASTKIVSAVIMSIALSVVSC
jgi:hypothetical protein